ncbi:MAG: hypothetical protein OEL54_04230, partial [Flavobacteriaceae bacterium]|nr:hypothetical protein [Flavobacteriaceae bacterium]
SYTRGFHFGPHTKWINYCKRIPIFKVMNDYAGTYSGKKFLTDLRDSLHDFILNNENCETIKDYYSLLNDFPFPLEECILYHN